MCVDMGGQQKERKGTGLARPQASNRITGQSSRRMACLATLQQSQEGAVPVVGGLEQEAYAELGAKARLDSGREMRLSALKKLNLGVAIFH